VIKLKLRFAKRNFQYVYKFPFYMRVTNEKKRKISCTCIAVVMRIESASGQCSTDPTTVK